MIRTWIVRMKGEHACNHKALNYLFFCKKGHSRPLFLYFRLFYNQLTANKRSIKVADDWIQTQVLWYQKRPLCQLCHTTAQASNYLTVVLVLRLIGKVHLGKPVQCLPNPLQIFLDLGPILQSIFALSSIFVT